MRKREINIIVSFRSYPMRNRKFPKNSKKIQKINRPRKRENKNYCSVPTRRVIENSKKVAKKFKKLKNSTMDSFQTKYVRKGRESEKKKITVSFCPTRHVIENSRKIAKKFRKLKKYHYDIISRKNRLEKAEK